MSGPVWCDCPICNGEGSLVHYSKKHGKATEVCISCHGEGGRLV